MKCMHCNAKENYRYVYKADSSGKSFQVRFSCGRVVGVHKATNYEKVEIRPCSSQVTVLGGLKIVEE